jgi:hypothetical protein
MNPPHTQTHTSPLTQIRRAVRGSRPVWLALALILSFGSALSLHPLAGQARSTAVRSARAALTGGVETARKWMTPSSKVARSAASMALAMPEPVVPPKNAGDGMTNDGITNATGTACAAASDGLWESAATEQVGVFTSTFSADGLPVGVTTNEGTFLKDVNGDGNLDIVFILDAASGGNAGTYVWLGNGDGTFATSAVEKKTYSSLLAGGNIETGASLSEATFVGDLNGDNRGDILYVVDGSNPVHGASRAGTYVWLANSDGTFATAAIEKKTYTNTAGSPLTAGMLSGIGANEGTYLADVDGDTKLDLVYVVDSSVGAAAGTYAWLGNGDGTFATAAIEKKTYTSTLTGGDIDAGTNTNESTFVGDVNNDGKADIVYVRDNSTPTEAGTYVWLGNGDGTFATAAIEKKTYTSTLASSKIDAGANTNQGTFLVDADNDGKLDLLYVYDGASGLSPGTAGTYLWLGQGDGTFATASLDKKNYTHSNGDNTFIEIGTSQFEASRVADVNKDGRLDIVYMPDTIFGSFYSGVYVWKGRCATPPSATLSKAFSPTSLSVGQESTLTFTITGPNINNIAFTDTLPSGLVVSSPNGINNTCGTGSVTANSNSNSISVSGVNVGASACTISVKVTPTTSGNKVNNASNFSGTSNVTVTNAYAEMGVVPNPTLSAAFNPSAVVLNSQTAQNSTLTFTVNNAALALGPIYDSAGSGNARAEFCPPIFNSASGGSMLESTASSSAGRTATRKTSRSVRGGGAKTGGTSAEELPPLGCFLFPAQSGIGFTNTLPAGLVLAAAPTASQCGGTVSGSAGGNTIIFSGGSLSEGTPSCTIQALVKPTTLGLKSNTSANVSAAANLTTSGVNASLMVNNTAAGANSCYSDKGVTVCFSNVTAQFDTTITPINPNTAGTVPSGYVLNPPNLAFDITTSATTYTGPITITFNKVPVNDAATFAGLRVLHGEGSPLALVDRTVLPPDSPAPDFAGRSISARVNSLSPFAIGMLTGPPVAVSDQKAGSVLVFPYYTSAADGSFSKSDTLITISNVCNGAATQANGAPNYQFLHVFFINGQNCSPADTFVCLTPNGSIQIKASDYDPTLTGYLVAVAVDEQGRPTQNNCFIGSAFVRDDANGVVDSYGAEAFWKLASGSISAGVGSNATISLDGAAYDAAPVQFSAQVQDPAVADELIVLASVSGNLGTALAATSQTGAGVLYRADEAPASFQPQIGAGCFSVTAVDKSKIRVVPGNLDTFLKDSYGYLKFNVSSPAVGLLISKQGPANQGVNRFSGIRALHKTAVGGATLVAPCFPPFCGF